jgi:DNA-binding response OmpR family regulator
MIALSEEIKAKLKTLVTERTGLYFKDYSLQDFESAIRKRMRVTKRRQQWLKKILIIDDSPTALETISAALEGEGAEIITALTATEGMGLAVSGAPDLIIIDTLLPDMDGFETCRNIRKSSQNMRLKILMITGSVDAIDAVRARKSGADDYCVKTRDLKPMLETVKKLL